MIHSVSPRQVDPCNQVLTEASEVRGVEWAAVNHDGSQRSKELKETTVFHCLFPIPYHFSSTLAKNDTSIINHQLFQNDEFSTRDHHIPSYSGPCSLWFCHPPNPRNSCMARVKPQYKESTMTKKRVKWHLGCECISKLGCLKGSLLLQWALLLICFSIADMMVSGLKDLVVASPRLQLRFEDTYFPSSCIASPSNRIQWFMLCIYHWSNLVWVWIISRFQGPKIWCRVRLPKIWSKFLHLKSNFSFFNVIFVEHLTKKKKLKVNIWWRSLQFWYTKPGEKATDRILGFPGANRTPWASEHWVILHKKNLCKTRKQHRKGGKFQVSSHLTYSLVKC